MPTREIYWNVQGIWVMYALFLVTAAVFIYGFYQHYRIVSIGRPIASRENRRIRAVGVVAHALVQVRGLRDRYSGAMHLCFFWSFLVLFLGTVVVFLQADLRVPIMHGVFYLYFQSLTLDVVGVLGVLGLSLAALKRYVFRPDRLLNPSRHRSLLDDGLILGLLLAILLTGLVLEGLRIAATADPWSAWSPAGLAVARLLLTAGLGRPVLVGTHAALWWVHMLLAFSFIAYIPYSKLRHLVLSPISIYVRSLEPMGALKPIDLEAEGTLGAAKFEDLSRKQLLDTLACTECGRCQEACPAYATGQPLSPKALVLDLRNALYRSKSPLSPTAWDILSRRARAVADGGDAPAVAAVGADALWSCVTCGSCMERCPVFVEQVPTIVDLRRYLVMERAEYPEPMQEALGSMEARGHPFRGTTASRTDWCEGLGVRIVGESGPAEWLYWVGCAAAFDERNQRVARAFAQLLQRAGVDFAILGEEEQCTGDTARRIGNEYLFQTMAQANLDTLKKYGIQKIVTACPHCFNTLRNEYPQFGGHFEVWHHTELIDLLLRAGRLRPATSDGPTLTLHDSCYLARYNRITSEPRSILAALGSPVREADRNREETYCCGGGSGHLWFEEVRGKRINHERARQLASTGAQAVASSCPFCMIMLSDGTKACGGESPMEVLDVAELVERATAPTPAAP